MPSKTKTRDTSIKEDDSEQSERFREAARNLGATDDKAFKRVIAKVLKKSKKSP